MWEDEADFDDLRYGNAIRVGADLSMGPLLFAYGRTDDDQDRFYFLLGTIF